MEKNNKEKKSKLDFSIKKNMAFKFMYNGKNYEGLVLQSHTNNTVESHIFNALKKASLIEDISKIENNNYTRCGRTDAGVSSTGNVFSIELRYKPNLDYIKIINNLLPDDIMITGSSEVDDSFDARFSCLYREYKYFFMRSNMNVEKMKLGCRKLEGVHNFKNFCKIDKSDPNFSTKNYERRIFEFYIEKCDNFLFPSSSFSNFDNPYFEMFSVTIKGSAFLWHQVRCMMGILFLIGKGLEDLDVIDQMFNVNSNKIFNYEIASETPLVLSDCQFEGVTFTNTIENLSDNFFSIGKIYEQNLTQIAINSFFYRNVTSLIKPMIKHEEDNLSYDKNRNFTEINKEVNNK